MSQLREGACPGADAAKGTTPVTGRGALVSPHWAGFQEGTFSSLLWAWGSLLHSPPSPRAPRPTPSSSRGVGCSSAVLQSPGRQRAALVCSTGTAPAVMLCSPASPWEIVHCLQTGKGLLLKPSQSQKEEIVGEYNAQIMEFYPASNGKAAPKIFSPAETRDFMYRKENHMFLGILVSCEMAQPVL